METRTSLKFRLWSFLSKDFIYFDIYEGANLGIAGGVSCPQQFTGLLDKNGKEIFEGDLVDFIWLSGPGSDEHETSQEVYWDDGMFLFGRDLMFAMNDSNFLTDTLEVVGNIFDEKAKREVILDKLTEMSQELQMGYE